MSMSTITGEGNLSGQADAATGTPADGAWSGFVSDADGIVSDLHTAASNLGRALSLAAEAYRLADESSSGSGK